MQLLMLDARQLKQEAVLKEGKQLKRVRVGYANRKRKRSERYFPISRTT